MKYGINAFEKVELPDIWGKKFICTSAKIRKYDDYNYIISVMPIRQIYLTFGYLLICNSAWCAVYINMTEYIVQMWGNFPEYILSSCASYLMFP